MAGDSFIIRPGEEKVIAIETSNKLPSGVTVTSATVAAYDLETRVDYSSTGLVSTTATIDGTKAIARAVGINPGRATLIQFDITVSGQSNPVIEHVYAYCQEPL